MAQQEELSIVVRMRSDGAGTRVVEQEVNKVVNTMDRGARRAETSWKNFGISWRSLITGGILALGLRRLISSSEELSNSWNKWKKDLMDSGPNAALGGLGRSVGQLVSGITGMEDSARGFGSVITPIINFVSDGIKGWAMSIRAAREAMGAPVQEREMSADEILNMSLYKAELTKDETESVKELILAKSRGETIDRVGLALLKKYTDQMRTKIELDRAENDFIKDVREQMAGKNKALEEYNEKVAEYRDNLAEANKWEQQWMSDDNYDKIIRSKRAWEEMTKVSSSVTVGMKKLSDQSAVTSMAVANIGAKVFAGAQRQARAYVDSLREVKGLLQEIWSTMTESVIRVFDDWVEGELKPAREYLKQIARELANMAIRFAMQAAFSAATAAIGMASGGVMKGGLQGIPTAAGGAVVRGPKLMILGDNPSREEAAVPLRNGKIPVENLGGGAGGNTYNINIRAIDSQSFASSMRNNRKAVRMAHDLSMSENPGYARLA